MKKVEAYLRRRNNGIYYAGFKQADNKPVKWVSLKTKRKLEAEDMLKQMLHPTEEIGDISENHPIGMSPSLLAFRSYYNNQLKEVVAPGTLSTYNCIYDMFVKDYTVLHPENTEISKITLFDINAWVRAESARHLTNTTVNGFITVMKSLFNRAKKWGFIKTNPFDSVEKLKVRKEPKEFLTPEEFSKVIEHTKKQISKDIFIFAAHTGVRAGELVNLTWDCIDFDRNLITIKNTKRFTTKTNMNRSVPMNSEVKQALERRLKDKNGEYVFHKVGFKRGVHSLRELFQSSCELAGIKKKMNFHSLRHTFISWCIMSKIELNTIKEYVGHSSLALIDSVYGHLTAQYRHDEISKLEQFVNGKK